MDTLLPCVALYDPLDVFLGSALRTCAYEGSMVNHVHRLRTSNSEFVRVVGWHGRHYISGKDLVHAVVHRLVIMGLAVKNAREFEDSVLADLRSLQEGVAFVTEAAHSPLLSVLHSLGCVRTQKRQRVFNLEALDLPELVHAALVRDQKRVREGRQVLIALADDDTARLDYLRLSSSALMLNVQEGQSVPLYKPVSETVLILDACGQPVDMQSAAGSTSSSELASNSTEQQALTDMDLDAQLFPGMTEFGNSKSNDSMNELLAVLMGQDFQPIDSQPILSRPDQNTVKVDEVERTELDMAPAQTMMMMMMGSRDKLEMLLESFLV